MIKLVEHARYQGDQLRPCERWPLLSPIAVESPDRPTRIDALYFVGRHPRTTHGGAKAIVRGSSSSSLSWELATETPLISLHRPLRFTTGSVCPHSPAALARKPGSRSPMPAEDIRANFREEQ